MLSLQVDLKERRSRRDMSPQGRKRVAGMVSRDYQTVSGVGGGQQQQQQPYSNQQVSLGWTQDLLFGPFLFLSTFLNE